MLNFDLCTPSRILFGKDQQNEVGALLKPLTKKLLLHYGGGSIKKMGLYDQVVASLNAAGIQFVELGGVMPNPRLSLVHEGIALCKQEQVDFILAVGGGSVIDSAKAIAAGVCYDGDIWDVYEQNLDIPKALPVATVLTIPAAGSESSESTVITNEEKQLKIGYSNQKLRPVFSIMNPEFFFTLPRDQMANGVADMMSHVLERYFTNTTHTDLTDGLCETVLRTIMRNAEILNRDPKNYDAWAEIGFAGTVAHNGLLGMGRTQDWACHGMEHELSAIYDVAHGAGLAVLTPSWMTYVYRENPEMFVQFAVNVMGIEGSYRQRDDLIMAAIEKLKKFFQSLGQPSTLRGLHIGEEHLEEMAKRATGVAYGREESPLGGFKKLYWQDILEIYRAAR